MTEGCISEIRIVSSDKRWHCSHLVSSVIILSNSLVRFHGLSKCLKFSFLFLFRNWAKIQLLSWVLFRIQTLISICSEREIFPSISQRSACNIYSFVLSFVSVSANCLHSLFRFSTSSGAVGKLPTTSLALLPLKAHLDCCNVCHYLSTGLCLELWNAVHTA